MNLTLVGGERSCHMVISGKVTEEFSAQLEAGFIGAMRRYARLTIDLSGVAEIDRFGLRLLAVMRSLGGKEVAIVATSPAVERASAPDTGVRQLH
jgi:anti-anti-sigma regulatory factor